MPDEQQIVNQMLEMQAEHAGSTDPVSPEVNPTEPAAADAAANVGDASEGDSLAVAEGGTDVDAPASESPQKQAPARATPVNLEDTFDKSSKAFAEQRLKLKQQDELLMRFAQVANLKATSPEDAYAKLSGIVTQQEAKEKNLDPIILRTLQDQEAKLAAYEQEEIKKEANQSFIDLQKQFNLDTKDLTAFAKQLAAEGVNPFAQRGINLSQHYLSLNYQKLLERAREQGRKEEAERQKRVAAQSTSPSGQTGQSPAQSAASRQASTGNEFEDFAKLLGIR